MQQIKEKYIINEKGQKTAVILSIKGYEKILEDLHDISVVAERRDVPTITFDELNKNLYCKSCLKPFFFNIGDIIPNNQDGGTETEIAVSKPPPCLSASVAKISFSRWMAFANRVSTYARRAYVCAPSRGATLGVHLR